MMAGTAQFEVAHAAPLVREIGAVAVSPDYRLAPENPFPAALDDCMVTLEWMVKHADELGIDPDRIAVAERVRAVAWLRLSRSARSTRASRCGPRRSSIR